MAYSYWELALYFFFYSFLGWLVEVGIYAIKEKRVCNRGILTLPLSFSYGISMVLLILLLPTLFGPRIIWYTFGIYEGLVLIVAWILLKRSERNGIFPAA